MLLRRGPFYPVFDEFGELREIGLLLHHIAVVVPGAGDEVR